MIPQYMSGVGYATSAVPSTIPSPLQASRPTVGVPLGISTVQQIVAPAPVFTGGIANPLYASNPALSRVPYSAPIAPLHNVTVPLHETPLHYTPHNWCW